MKYDKVQDSKTTSILRVCTKSMAFCAVLLLTSCGYSNNVVYTTQAGTCPNNVTPSAPYCMAVTIQNNANNQNWITNTSFPISGLTVSVSGVTNVQTPSTNKATLDPNNCTGTNIQPGASCTFYLQLVGEAYPVTSIEPVTVTLNYSVNSNLFGGGTSGSSQFTIFEATNLYILQRSAQTVGTGLVGAYNGNGLSSSFVSAESGDTPISLSVDNNTYGYIYIGGASLGVYAFGNGSNSGSITPVGIGGASNLFTNSNLLYLAANNPSATGIYSYNLSTLTYNSTAVYTTTNTFAQNINTKSTVPVFYLVATAGGTSGNTVNACVPVGSTTSSICTNEATSGSGTTALSGAVTALGFLSVTGGVYTGLYAATTTGLYLETISPTGGSVSPNNTWTLLPASASNITVMAMDTNGNLYAGDASGNIWYVNAATPLILNQFSVAPASGGISSIAVDNNGLVLYVTTLNNLLYSCSISTVTPSACTLAFPPNLNNGMLPANPVVGMVIGSQLLSSI